VAAERGRTETARLLLEAGSDFMARDANGRTPLFRAIERGRSEIVRLLHTAALVNSSQQSPTRAFVAEGETVPPVIIQWTDTPYTDYGLKQGIEGTVVLMALVRENGSIGAVSVSKSLEESLDQNAVRAVRTWKFDPATRGGKPVVVVVEINVDFELPEDS
jgi:TonB family protein